MTIHLVSLSVATAANLQQTSCLGSCEDVTTMPAHFTWTGIMPFLGMRDCGLLRSSDHNIDELNSESGY